MIKRGSNPPLARQVVPTEDKARSRNAEGTRSEEHTSELQSQSNLVCRHLLEKNSLAFFANEPYSAAKAGLISLTYSMATRYGRHWIRAVAVAPGTIRTPIWQERVDKEPEIFE